MDLFDDDLPAVSQFKYRIEYEALCDKITDKSVIEIAK